MLLRAMQRRARHLVAVYVESDRIEVLWAHRKWRSWEIENAELYTFSEGESVFEALQRLNPRVRDPGKTAVVLFLALPYYSVHREHYPIALEEQLEHAVAFDWQENLFFDQDQTLSFAGPPCRMEHHLSVPIFSIRREIADRFSQALSGAAYQSFSMIPSALYYGVFAGAREEQGAPNGDSLETFGRMVHGRQLELHRYLNGALLESFLVGPDAATLRLVRENLTCSSLNGEDEPARVRRIVSVRHPDDAARGEAFRESLPLEDQWVEGLMLEAWVPRLLDQESAKTFETPLALRPWEVPKVVWPVLAAFVLYGAFAFYEIHSFHQAKENSIRLKRQIATLESQWKPIEQLQTRIAKFEEDQKTLSQFDLEGYPLLEMLTLLTSITPEDTWLNYFSIRKGQVILRGESKSAIKYLPELSKVEGFTDVKFASPVTRNPSADSERFNVQLQLDLEKFRKTVASLAPAKEEIKENGAAPTGEPSTPVTPGQGQPEAQAPQEEEGGEVDEVTEEDLQLEVDQDTDPAEEEGEEMPNETAQ